MPGSFLLGRHVDFFQVVSEILTFIRTQDPEGETDQCPQMDRSVFSVEVMGQIVDLRMTVVARSNAVISICRHNLVKLNLAIGPTFIGIP